MEVADIKLHHHIKISRFPLTIPSQNSEHPTVREKAIHLPTLSNLVKDLSINLLPHFSTPHKHRPYNPTLHHDHQKSHASPIAKKIIQKNCSVQYLHKTSLNYLGGRKLYSPRQCNTCSQPAIGLGKTAQTFFIQTKSLEQSVSFYMWCLVELGKCDGVLVWGGKMEV